MSDPISIDDLDVPACLDRRSKTVAINVINVDGQTQMRAMVLDPEVVEDYAINMADGAEFPPIILFYDGEKYWPGDGFHRIAAARRIGP